VFFYGLVYKSVVFRSAVVEVVGDRNNDLLGKFLSLFYIVVDEGLVVGTVVNDSGKRVFHLYWMR